MMSGLLMTLPLILAAAEPDFAASDAIPMTGRARPGLTGFEDLIPSFMADHRIPGGALAVVRHGRLVYARGFGYADRERRQPVQPDSLFRIASLSKPVTAVAVLQLAEQHRLRLDDRVFDLLHDRFPLPEDGSADPRLKEITIRHLLQHTGGWDREESFDPMFRAVEFAKQLDVAPPARPEQIIQAMATQKLDFDPGARYAYSNYGYCLLGRVIETVTEKPYEDAVRDHVLRPAGITRMRLGHTLPEGRAEGEVCYYTPENETGPAVMGPQIGKPVPQPYGAWCLESLDAHGGWIASAVDLARFAAALEPDAPHPLLTPASWETMWARPEGRPGHEEDGMPSDWYYGCGWAVRPMGKRGVILWHTGSLPGTSALLVRRHDGLTWCILFNSRGTYITRHPAALIDLLLHRVANAVKTWPDDDLFPEFR